VDATSRSEGTDHVRTRTGVLELAVLGLLHDTPMHGYELRKRLTAILGWGRTLSYGSLYPCLKQMLSAGLIAEDPLTSLPGPGTETDRLAARSSRRGKIVYKLTPDGKEHLQQLLDDAGPASWEDETFGVHLAFFGQTDREVRMRILEGRRSRLEERRDGAKTAVQRARERLDEYTLELHRHGLESVEREVRWLTELIDTEHNRPSVDVARQPSGDQNGVPPP
jgi:DNA-binding PadR family transcriptional regulator